MPSARFFNTIDAIPMAWNNLAGIKQLFPGGPSCSWAMDGVIDLVNDWLDAIGVSYMQTNGAGSQLPGTPTKNSDWFTEAGIQHGHNTYLGLLNAPPIDVVTVVNQKPHAGILMQA